MYMCTLESMRVCILYIYIFIYINYIIYDQGAASSNKSLYVFGIPGAYFFFLSLDGMADGWMDALSLA